MSGFGFPERAFLQGHAGGRLTPESTLVSAELTKRGVPFTVLTSEDFVRRTPRLTRKDLVVGDFTWTRTALKQLGVPMPVAPDYPRCLQHLLHRRMWTSTLFELYELLEADPQAAIFFKPLADIKAFSGDEASLDWVGFLLQEHPPTLEIHCAEIVKMVSEFRVYVVDGVKRAVCQYKGPKEVAVDMAVVDDAVRTLFATEEGAALAGCGMDFAVIEQPDGTHVTALIEVNDGFSLGNYEGLSAEDYTDLLIAR
jgi:hypothetical protein